MFRNVLNAFIACTLMATYATSALAQESGLAQQLSNSDRPEEDKERDSTRKPAEVLAFLGIDEGMTVVDLFAIGGYYTEVLAIAVGPDGRVISHNFPRLMSRESVVESIRARRDRHDNIEVLVNNLSDGVQTAEIADIGPHYTDPAAYTGRVDAVITALNMHDFVRYGEETAQALLASVYEFLKPGGVFGVIDHRGVDGYDNEALHRITFEELSEQLEKAGFVVEAESDILSNPLDDHSLHMRDESLGRNTDRILVRARKPVQ
jgi:predicted methyltransferase